MRSETGKWPDQLSRREFWSAIKQVFKRRKGNPPSPWRHFKDWLSDWNTSVENYEHEAQNLEDFVQQFKAVNESK